MFVERDEYINHLVLVQKLLNAISELQLSGLLVIFDQLVEAETFLSLAILSSEFTYHCTILE